MLDLPPITDSDEEWAARLLGLPASAFRGEDGQDKRSEVLRNVATIDVAACPGSGKTTLLVAKLAVLARHWPSTSQGVCVLSHTNAARREIESRLACDPICDRLLERPHFVGTIHSFIDEFMMLPWLRSLGYPVRLIDTEICQRRRWSRYSHGSKHALAQHHLEAKDIRIADADFSPVRNDGQPLPFGAHTATYADMKAVCKAVALDGYHCYEDAFVWARDLLGKHSGVISNLRDRFPLLFIDEAQDNSEEQSALLHQLFVAGPNPVVRQRFGDANQAIYDFVGAVGATTDCFPDAAVTIDLPVSHRFAQPIADLADPLAIAPCGLVGAGAHLEVDCVEVSENVLLLFDVDALDLVLPAFGELLVETFSQEDLADGSFVAVGHVHRTPAVTSSEKSPQCVAHYWADYDYGIPAGATSAKKYVQGLLAGQQQSRDSGQTYEAVEILALATLKLVALADGHIGSQRGTSAHRKVLGLLASTPQRLEEYTALFEKYCINLEDLTKTDWENTVRSLVEGFGCAGAGVDAIPADASSYLDWSEAVTEEGPAKTPNVFEYSSGAGTVDIRLGSIHSVKGETHTAVLVLETYWYAHSLAKLAPWILGEKSGGGAETDRQNYRLRTHYVAMTRASHVLCLAMKRESLLSGDADSDAEIVAKLETRGWQVRILDAEAPPPSQAEAE